MMELPVLPIRNTVLFPLQTLPLLIGRPRSLRAIESALRARPHPPELVIVTQKNLTLGDPEAADLHEIAVRCRILETPSPPVALQNVSGSTQSPITVEGICRVRLDGLHLNPKPDEYLLGRTTPLPAPRIHEATRTEALLLSVESLLRQLLRLGLQVSRGLISSSSGSSELSARASRVVLSAACELPLSLGQKQTLLEQDSLDSSLELIFGQLKQELRLREEQRELEARILGRKKTTEKASRREDETTAESSSAMDAREDPYEEPPTDDSFEKSEAGRLALAAERKLREAPVSDGVLQQVQEELARLRTLPPGSAEHSVLRNWFEWIGKLPWASRAPATTDLHAAQRILDEEHSGLFKIKKRLLESMAVARLRGSSQNAQILCLVGPPGVGKTSLARSMARALGRPYARVSLGGVRDEAEIRGHRRTYVGAMPGKILQALRRAGSRHALLLLDEIDKLRNDIHGDPSAALLEVLDPELNSEFQDHYLNLPFDLSGLFLVGTANDISLIPPALRDRLEVIEIPGYSPAEKKHIALRHLIPRESKANGFCEPDREDLAASTELDRALDQLIGRYTREAGVRELQRKLAALFRASALTHCLGREPPGSPPSLDIKKLALSLPETLGPPAPEPTPARWQSPGTEPFAGTQSRNPPWIRKSAALGLAWSPHGGELLRLEGTLQPGSGKITLTGNLGDILQESIQVALSLARATLAARNPGVPRPTQALEEQDLHIHAPLGATPKDGPSAGVPLYCLILALLGEFSLPSNEAYSGELGLLGDILPVGGLEQKLQAARRHGIRRVHFPALNREHLLGNVEPEAMRDLQVQWVASVEELTARLLPLAPAAELATLERRAV